MNRILSLDVLRGIAVLLVIVRHCDAAFGTWLEPVRRGGWVGVDLFFVLSGFLVSGLLFREHAKTGAIRPVRFLMRRGWKIYPAFWVLIAVTAVLFGFNWSKTINELAFVQSYTMNRWWGHTWSLAVEEHFYILLPLMFVPMSKDGFRSLPRIVAMILVGLLVAKCINGTRPFTEHDHIYPTHLRLDGLFFGVLLAYWHHSWPAFNDFCKRYSIGLIVAGVVLLTPAFVFNVETTRALYTYWLTAQIIAAGMILMGMVCGGVRENRFTKTIGWIGTFSYSIYLWHNMVTLVIAPMLGINSTFLSVLGSVALGIAMSKLVESPCLWLRDRMAKPSLA